MLIRPKPVSSLCVIWHHKATSDLDVWVLRQRNRKRYVKGVHTETGGWEKDGFLQILIYRVPIVPISLFQILNRIPEQETMVSFLNLWEQHLHELFLLYVNDTVENHVHLRADWNKIRNETEDIGEIVKRRENTNVCYSDCEEDTSDDPPSFELRLILRLI